jgi:type I restriction enzyme S subunit
MSKTTKAEATPRLRFPEFDDATGWRTVPLEHVAYRKTTKNVDGTLTRVLTNSAEHGVVDQRDYFDRDIATAGKVDAYYVVEVGDFVYNPRTSSLAPVGPISRNNIGRGVMSPLYTVFRFRSDDTDFYDHYFSSEAWHSYIRSAASTGARHDRLSISNSAFMRVPVPVPSPAEERKIAACLTSLDDVIAAQAQKVEVLKAHKRGLMQQLFPHEGETVPRLRFPEFRDAPEWEELTIADLGGVITGSTPSTTRADYYGGEHSLVSPGDISDLRWIRTTKTTLTNEGYAQTRHVTAGSVLFVCIGSTIGKVAQNERECATNQQINAVVPIPDFSGAFIYYLLVHESERIAALAGVQAVPIISKGQFSSVNVWTPHLSEQSRIAEGLSAVDMQIAAESERLYALHSHKAGLMQQLFPAPAAD